MPSRNERDYWEEVYVERRHSEKPRYAMAPAPIPAPIPATPYFAPINYGKRAEDELVTRERSSVSSQGSSSSHRSRHHDADMIRYEDRHSRSGSVGSDRSSRRRSSSQWPTHAAAGRSFSACSTDCADAPTRRRSSAEKSVSHPMDEDPDWDSADEAERKKKARNKQLLYTGLAAITTIAATNNVYQSSKAFKARRQDVRDGVMCEAEAKSKRNKALAMDVFSVGVGAICVNNAVNGWKKTKAMRAEEDARRDRWEREDYRRKSIAAW